MISQSQKNKDYHIKNRDSILARKRKHHWDNRDEILARKARFRSENKERLNREQNEKMRAIRAELISLKGGKCESCGGEFVQDAFDFHHKDPTQKELKLSLSSMLRPLPVLLEEIDKCQLLCSNCHRTHHYHNDPHSDSPQIMKRREKRTKRKEYLVSLLGDSCSKCSKTFDRCVYDFHHKDPSTKSFSIGRSIDKPLELLEVEVHKCEILCSNCHRETHSQEREKC